VTARSAGTSGVWARASLRLNTNTDVEIAGDFQNRSFKGSADAVPDAAADDGGGTYLVAGRAFVKGGANVMWVPVARIYSFDLSSVSPAAVTTDSKMFGLGGRRRRQLGDRLG
jgi:hypothetical protein